MHLQGVTWGHVCRAPVFTLSVVFSTCTHTVPGSRFRSRTSGRSTSAASHAEKTIGAKSSTVHNGDEGKGTNGQVTLGPGGAKGRGRSAAASPEPELPYGGDLQAAMRAQDRNAIKVLMRKRDGKPPLEEAGSGGVGDGGDSGSNKLPYGGDLQAAMKAQDRNAIRDIIRWRDGKPQWTGVGNSGESKGEDDGTEGLQLGDAQIAEAADVVKKATLGHGGRGKSGKRHPSLELPYGGDLRSGVKQFSLQHS